MKTIKLWLTIPTIVLIASCQNSNSNNDSKEMHLDKQSAITTLDANANKNVNFLAFGDGGYSVDYPKKKHIKNPRNKVDFIAKEKQDWLEDFRPIEEFDYAPIYMYPNTEIATEDSGAVPVGQAMSDVCLQRKCDFGIQLGDNIYPDGADANDGKDDQKRMDDLILTPLLPLLKQAPEFIVYSALGNHDWKTSRKGVALQTEWMNEQEQFHLDEAGYYSYIKGEPGNDVEFFVLDTNMILSGQTFYEIPLNSDGSERDLQSALKLGTAELESPKVHEGPVAGEDEAQLKWLEQGLANSKAKWKIVYGHHILWSIGGTKYSEGHVLRKVIMPTLCKYADAYIAGHEHDLELLTDDCSRFPEAKRTEPLPLIISGAASKMRGKHTPFAEYQENTYPEYELIWSKSFVWGFAHINIDNDENKLNVEFFTTPREKTGSVNSAFKHSFSHK